MNKAVRDDNAQRLRFFAPWAKRPFATSALWEFVWGPMSFGSQNPFQAPNFTDLPPAGAVENASGLSSSILIQLRVLAILLLVHGGLVIVMGLFFAVMAVAMPTLFEMQKAQMKQMGQAPPPNLPVEAQTMMLFMYGGIAVAGVLGGVVQMAAGFRMLWLKSRVLGFVALASCLLSCVTCYCIPTSLGLAIYGLIVLVHPAAERTFALSQQGKTFDEILQLATMSGAASPGKPPFGAG